MSPVPKMVIDSPSAVKKGKIEVSSVDEIDALRAELDEAETMIRRVQEPERRDPAVTAKIAGLGDRVQALSQPAEPAVLREDRERYHGHVHALDGTLRFCALAPGHENGCRDADGHVIITVKPDRLAKVHPLRPDSEVTIVGSVDHHPTFTCCETPVPWPAAGLDVTCPDCHGVWEREPVAVGIGAHLKVRGAAS